MTYSAIASAGWRGSDVRTEGVRGEQFLDGMRLVRMLLVSASFLLGGCRGSDFFKPTFSDSVAGAYALQFVNGEPLPHIVTVADTTLKILADTFFIRADDTYSERAYYNTPSGAVSSQGTYSHAGDTYTFVDAANPSSVVTASISKISGFMEVDHTSGQSGPPGVWTWIYGRS